jgi:hypothetical protein
MQMKHTNSEDRITFYPDLEIMEVDFSNLIFSNKAEVNRFYDTVDRLISETGRDWYFLVNYENCTIEPDAWFQHALRGKRINIAHSLGSVRYNPEDAMHLQILKAAKTEDFNPNVVATREEALERIKEFRQQRGRG